MKYKQQGEHYFDRGEGLARATEILQMISNPVRLTLLCELLSEKEIRVGDLSSRVGLSQSALSQHLAKLRASGLVETRRDQQWIYYRIEREDIKKIIGLLHSLYCQS